MTFTKVEGAKNDHKVTLYALSTCGWCKKTKELLDQLNVEYEYLFCDLCVGDERAEAIAAVKELNPRGSYPTLKIDDEVLVGFDEERMTELLA